MEALVYLLTEIVGQVVLDSLLEYGLRPILFSTKRRDAPLRFIAHAGLGLSLGGLSLAVYSGSIVPNPLAVRVLGLIAIPVGTGLCMGWLGRRRRARGRTPTSVASFVGAATIAFFYTLVRFLAHLHAAAGAAF